MTLTWITIGLLAWIVVPVPLAILVGRVFSRENSTGDVAVAPSALTRQPRATVKVARVG